MVPEAVIYIRRKELSFLWFIDIDWKRSLHEKATNLRDTQETKIGREESDSGQ